MVCLGTIASAAASVIRANGGALVVAVAAPDAMGNASPLVLPNTTIATLRAGGTLDALETRWFN